MDSPTFAPHSPAAPSGTFKRSNIGFGTIVGSAVFNVLFVIGTCAMATPEVVFVRLLAVYPVLNSSPFAALCSVEPDMVATGERLHLLHHHPVCTGRLDVGRRGLCLPSR